jgi:hypothetical protein
MLNIANICVFGLCSLFSYNITGTYDFVINTDAVTDYVVVHSIEWTEKPGRTQTTRVKVPLRVMNSCNFFVSTPIFKRFRAKVAQSKNRLCCYTANTLSEAGKVKPKAYE